ncbi:MAG: response regulator transcription factor [Prevotella sp.]|jgi:DNA-binding CsgD family transcriptional regulator|uniref:helix-turn-helix transcriptional regulator n=1 Tax=uncultured Prevotella sp. TaxID=159272 RepID=UPI0025CF98EC|nr:LuxR C-terminal-related transcriptional regulator [uncultured Prevotella sp.]MBQ1827583.1 response regulator transcription factor [Prevotella sp.]MBQ5496606.1 response regulator transcription factor [Prevotella sp.]
MDVLRKELQTVFHRHEFRLSALDEGDIEACRRFIGASTAISQGCAILSDLATNGSYFAIGRLVDILGLHGEVPEEELIDIDEDFIYRRIHPEDLVDKRMLELRYFEMVDDMRAEERLKYHATCRIRMQKANGDYTYIHNVTRIQMNDADGLMRLVTCLYELSPEQEPIHGINPSIINVETGAVQKLALYEERFNILSKREREILLLIKQGLLSKEIADTLHISIHTVNTHRQNILQKLSVDNSMEAVQTATAMMLL